MGERSPWVRNVAAESLADLATIPGVAGLERGGRKPRMMVVDDDAGFRTMLRDWLEEEQVRVVAEAADGAKAVELATDTSPDLILMDLRMPKLDGLQAALKIRASRPSTQVIMLSAYGDTSLRYAAEDAGVYSYLEKGCSTQVLWETIGFAWSYKLGLDEERAPRDSRDSEHSN